MERSEDLARGETSRSIPVVSPPSMVAISAGTGRHRGRVDLAPLEPISRMPPALCQDLSRVASLFSMKVLLILTIGGAPCSAAVAGHAILTAARVSRLWR